MTEQWNGVPENPERDGWHWLCAAVGIGAPYPMLWCADGKAWDTGDGWIFCTDPALTKRRRYLGPCLTPAEVAAREAASAEEMREACAKICDDCAMVVDAYTYAGPKEGGPYAPLARKFRALPLPHASALARALAAAEKRGMERAKEAAINVMSEWGGPYDANPEDVIKAIDAAAQEQSHDHPR